MSRVFERLGAGQMALGVWIKGGPTWVSTIARAGFDFVRPDMMFSSLDWGRAPQHPSRGTGGGPHHLGARARESVAVRHGAIAGHGGRAACFQHRHRNRRRVDRLRAPGARVSRSRKGLASVGHGGISQLERDLYRHAKKNADVAVFVPHIEAGTAVHEIDEILSLEGVRILMLAMTDLSKTLGHPFQYEHPEVWRHVDSIVEKAHARGIVIAANMGYDYTTHERMAARVKRMHDHGIRICLMQGADNMLENFAKPMLNDIRGAVA